MDVGDAGLIAGLFGVFMALIKLAEYAIKAAVSRRNGGENPTAHLVDIGRDQLKTLHDIDKEIAGIRSDLRSLWVATNHLDRKVDALHRRFDSQRRQTSETQ